MTTLSTALSSSTDDELEAMFDAVAPAVQQSPADALSKLAEIGDEAVRRDRHELAGHCHYLSARAHLNLGELDLALDGIDAAEQKFRAAGCDADAARTGLGKMNVLDDLGRHDEAIEVGRTLMSRLPTLRGTASDAMLDRLEAAALENIGVSNGSLGNHLTAMESYEQAERRYLDADLHLDAGRCLANRGVELIELDRPAEAVEALRAAGRVFTSNDDHLYAGMCAAYEASAQLRRGDFFEAHRLGLVAEAFLANADPTVEFARSQRIRAETLVALNLVDEALALYEKLETRFADGGLEHDAALATLGRANVLLRTGRTADATSAFHDAKMKFTVIGDRAMIAACRLGASAAVDDQTGLDTVLAAADEFASMGRRSGEILALLRAVDIAGRTVGDGSDVATPAALLERCDELLSREPLPHLAWQVRRAHGRLAIDAGDLPTALVHLHAAADEIERLRDSVAAEVSLVPFMGSRRDVHEDLVSAHLALGDASSALGLVTAARARTLVESHASAEPSPTAPADVVAPDIVPTDAFEAQITYEVLGREILAFVSVGGDLRVVRNVSDIPTIERLLRRLAAQWRRFEGTVVAEGDGELLMFSTVDLLQRLHDALLRPLDIGDVDGIVIVPVGLMANVPFAALHDGSSYLVERTRVAIAASIGQDVERDSRLTDHAGIPRRLVIGVPDELAPRVADEIEAIAALGNARTFVGADATVQALFDAAPDADIIHIACHGLHRSDRPSLSSLRLADRDVTAIEINELNLDGQFVVLSACSSGRQHASGNVDELMGLPRTFLAAGAAEVLVNLWQVDDAAASSLMSDLHARLGTQSCVAALRSAQLNLLASQPHPYYWAAAVTYVNVNQHQRQELS